MAWHLFVRLRFQEQFFEAGKSDAWIIHPEARRIERRFRDGTVQRLRTYEPLDAALLVSGFSFTMTPLLAVRI